MVAGAVGIVALVVVVMVMRVFIVIVMVVMLLVVVMVMIVVVVVMVVIVIMAVLAAAATPVFAGYVKKARAAEHLSECRAIYVAAQSCLEEAFLKAGEGTVTVEDLDMERFLKDVEELSGVGGIGSGEGTPGSGGSAGTFSIYLENGRDGAACTAVVFHGEGSDWVFDTVDGTYTEA